MRLPLSSEQAGLFQHFDRRIRSAARDVSVPAFMRSPGMRQTRSSKSTSSQVAPRTSPERVAETITNLSANFCRQRRRGTLSMVFNAAGTSRYGKARRCLLTAGMFGRAPSIISPATFDSIRPFAWHHRNVALDASAYTPGRFRFGGPDRRQYCQHVLAANAVYGLSGQPRERVALKLLHPVRSHLGVAPARPEVLHRSARPLREKSASTRAASPCASRPADRRLRVPACGSRRRLRARLGQTDKRVTAQADVVTLAADSQSLDPLFAARRVRHSGRGYCHRRIVRVPSKS